MNEILMVATGRGQFLLSLILLFKIFIEHAK